MASNADIARAAGVSPATVSRIVNNDETLRVSARTRARVLKIIDEMDYVPNAAARMLKATRTNLVALVVHDLTSSVYAEIIEGAIDAAIGFGKTILVGEARQRGSRPSHLESLISGKGVDALILQGEGTTYDHILERAGHRNMPTVLLQSGDESRLMVLCVDDAAAGRAGTEHLIALGHRRIGCIQVSRLRSFSVAREGGWRAAMQAAGLPASTSLEGGNNLEDGARAARSIMAADPSLTALFVANVVSAIGVVAGLTDAGYRVPEDVSVVAVHDIPLAGFLRPALTTIRMPLADLGRRAIEAVCTPETIRPGRLVVAPVAPEIVRRGTTAPPRR